MPSASQTRKSLNSCQSVFECALTYSYRHQLLHLIKDIVRTFINTSVDKPFHICFYGLYHLHFIEHMLWYQLLPLGSFNTCIHSHVLTDELDQICMQYRSTQLSRLDSWCIFMPFCLACLELWICQFGITYQICDLGIIVFLRNLGSRQPHSGTVNLRWLDALIFWTKVLVFHLKEQAYHSSMRSWSFSEPHKDCGGCCIGKCTAAGPIRTRLFKYARVIMCDILSTAVNNSYFSLWSSRMVDWIASMLVQFAQHIMNQPCKFTRFNSLVWSKLLAKLQYFAALAALRISFGALLPQIRPWHRAHVFNELDY